MSAEPSEFPRPKMYGETVLRVAQGRRRTRWAHALALCTDLDEPDGLVTARALCGRVGGIAYIVNGDREAWARERWLDFRPGKPDTCPKCAREAVTLVALFCTNPQDAS